MRTLVLALVVLTFLVSPSLAADIGVYFDTAALTTTQNHPSFLPFDMYYVARDLPDGATQYDWTGFNVPEDLIVLGLQWHPPGILCIDCGTDNFGGWAFPCVAGPQFQVASIRVGIFTPTAPNDLVVCPINAPLGFTDCDSQAFTAALRVGGNAPDGCAVVNPLAVANEDRSWGQVKASFE